MTFDELLVILRREMLDHDECVHPGAPRSVSRDAVIPVDVVVALLASHRIHFE